MREDRPIDATSDPPPAGLRAQLLGSVRIAIGDRVIANSEWPRRSARSLLLLLLATPGHRLSRERIIDLLWPDASLEAGANALRVALHALRRTLEPDLAPGKGSSYVRTDGEFIAMIPVVEHWVDVDHFEAALARLPSGAVEERPNALRDAVAHYDGELLADEPVTEWSLRRREQLRHLWHDAVLQLAEIEVKRGSLQSVPELERVLAIDPSDEAAHRALMKTFLVAGQRDKALRQYARCVEALRLELDVEPGAETVALAAEIRAACAVVDQGASPVHRGRIDILPSPPNPLIGRVRELETLQDLILDPGVRLVTVTGPGGIGKTRLALEAAREAAGEFPAGACFVDLSSLTEPGMVLFTILRTLGLDESSGRPAIEVLVHALRELDLLLVLDNLEQVIDAAVDIGALLSSCPLLSVLATSREPLRLRAEHIIATPPLSVPPVRVRDRSDPPAARPMDRYESVTLFVERARATRPGFALTDANESAIAALCGQLDGLPLAIELAAARSRQLEPARLLTQLAQRLPVLTGGARDLPARQRTLKDAIGWSYDLLPETEQALFRRMAVFAGDVGLEAIHGICGDPGDDLSRIAEQVWALADKSLLQRPEGHDGDDIRYRMLETIREFGLEQLESCGESDVLRRRHAAWYLALAELAESHLLGPDQIAWLDRLEQEHDNLRAALEWACEAREAETGLRISGALSGFWRMKGHLSEGRMWLQRSLTLAEPVPSPPRAMCLQGAGVLAQAQGDSEEAVAWLTQALESWRALGDQRRTGQTIVLLADIARARGDYHRSLELNERALVLFEEIGFSAGIADSLNQMGLIATDRGEYARARELYGRSSALYDDLADRHGAARVLNNLGIVSFWQEDYREAASLFQRALGLWRALGNRPHTALVLANLGEALRAEGDLEQAMAITREGLQVAREVGDRRSEAIALFILGSLVQHHEVDVHAIGPLVEGLRLFWQVGDRLGMAWCLEALAGPAVALGRPDAAGRFFGAAEALREQVSVPLQPAEQSSYQRHLDATRGAFDDPGALHDAWAEGRGLQPNDLLDVAEELRREHEEGQRDTSS